MASFVHSFEIARAPEDVFAYLDKLDRHHEWQDEIVSERVETDGPTRVGTRVSETRRMGRRTMDVPYEVTAHDPPRAFAFRGTAGPLRPVGSVTLEPLDSGARTRLTLTFDFEKRGIGYLVAPIAMRQAKRAIPGGHEKLKRILEGGGD
jgi:uncharacterized protein YndB with AHSA1/START domain